MRLQLTKRTDYAIRACLYLASGDHPGPASSRRIAQHMEIPERFLSQVLGDLTQAGIVEAQIGRSGGYRLRRSPNRLSILELIETVEGAHGGEEALLRDVLGPGRVVDDEVGGAVGPGPVSAKERLEIGGRPSLGAAHPGALVAACARHRVPTIRAGATVRSITEPYGRGPCGGPDAVIRLPGDACVRELSR